MLLLNYAHPLTSVQLDQITIMLDAAPDVRDMAVQIARERPIAEVACDLADAAGLTSQEWQSLPLIVNPPGLAPLALALIAELHGRCGHFPAVVNIRPVANAVPTRYEIAEVIDVKALHDVARMRR